MSESDETSAPDERPALAEGRTEEYPTMVYPPPDAPTLTLPGPEDADGATPEEPFDEADEEWVNRTASGIRLAIPLALLLAVVLVAAGFWGGAEVEKNHKSSSAAGGFAGLAARLGSGRGGALASLFGASGATGATGATGTTGSSTAGFGGFGGFGGSSAAATGTISVVDGDTLYVLTATGSLIKVSLSKSTTITRNADSTAVGLRPGDSVTVQGSTASDGNVSATSVSATAAGVSSTGGAGGRFAGLGAASTTATSTTAANG